MLLMTLVEHSLSQEHDGTEFPVALLWHTFTETQHKWSTTEQEAFGVYYTITIFELIGKVQSFAVWSLKLSSSEPS